MGSWCPRPGESRAPFTAVAAGETRGATNLSFDQVGMGVLLVGAFLAMLPSVLAFLALQRSFIRGLTSGAVKG
ncbi:ABC-type glycerol-3-phosphate transport system permease component [Streptomyces albogriseolus]